MPLELPTIEVDQGPLPWLKSDLSLKEGWALEPCDPFSLEKNEYGMLLGYTYEVPKDAKGEPILTVEAYAVDARAVP